MSQMVKWITCNMFAVIRQNDVYMPAIKTSHFCGHSALGNLLPHFDGPVAIFVGNIFVHHCAKVWCFIAESFCKSQYATSLV